MYRRSRLSALGCNRYLNNDFLIFEKLVLLRRSFDRSLATLRRFYLFSSSLFCVEGGIEVR